MWHPRNTKKRAEMHFLERGASRTRTQTSEERLLATQFWSHSTWKSDDKDLGPRLFKHVVRQLDAGTWGLMGGGGQCERMVWKAWGSCVLEKLNRIQLLPQEGPAAEGKQHFWDDAFKEVRTDKMQSREALPLLTNPDIQASLGLTLPLILWCVSLN